MGSCACCRKETDRTYRYYYAGTVVNHKVQQYQTTWTKGRTVSTKYANFQQMTGYICEDCSMYKPSDNVMAVMFILLLCFGGLSANLFMQGAYFWGGLSALVAAWSFLVIVQDIRSGGKPRKVTLSEDEGASMLIEKLHRRKINQLGIQVYFTPSEYKKLRGW